MNPRPYFAILAATTAMAAVPPALSAWRLAKDNESTCVDESTIATLATLDDYVDCDDAITALEDDCVDRVFQCGAPRSNG